MTKPSLVAVLLGAVAASACSSPSGSADGPPTPQPKENVGQTTEALSAYLTPEGASPIEIEDLEIATTTEHKDELARAGCGSIAKVGEGGVRFRARASYPTGFIDWASREMAKAPAGTTPRLPIAVVNEKKEVKCRVDVDPSSLEHLTLNGPGLVWELRGGVSVAAGDVTGDGRDGPIGEGIGDIIPAGPEPVAIGLLLPAVQKVREAASRTSTIPLYDKDGVLPPPFEVEVDSETFADLFDGAVGDELELGVLTLTDPQPPAAAGGGGMGGGKVVVHDISIRVQLKKEKIASSLTKVKVVPVSKFGIVGPLNDAQLDAARAKADALAAEIGAVLDLDDVSRLLSALEDQPSGSGAPASQRDALLWYWRGDPAKGTPGTATSFDSGLGSFLKKASDVEGLWAYRRLPVAAHIFGQLDSSRERALSGAGLQTSSDAAFPLRPGRLRTIGDVSGHDYRYARATAAQMGALADIIASGGPGGQALVGVEPDEIDVAVAAKAEALPAVSSVDAAARSFLLAREALLDAPLVDQTKLDDVAAKGATLGKEIDALRAVTKARFVAAK